MFKSILTTDDLLLLFSMLNEYNVLFETNCRYDLGRGLWWQLASSNQVNCVRGSDCHRIEEM